MSDFYSPLKLEQDIDGTQINPFPTEANTTQDIPVVPKLAVGGKTKFVTVKDGEIALEDEINGVYSLSELLAGVGGITEGSHKVLDQLVHNLAENSYIEITRTSGRVSDIIAWTDNGKTDKIREWNITRTSGRVTQIVVMQYDDDGSTVLETLTYVITRTSGRVTSITTTLT